LQPYDQQNPLLQGCWQHGIRRSLRIYVTIKVNVWSLSKVDRASETLRTIKSIGVIAVLFVPGRFERHFLSL
jgi:hypothetical protein